MTSVMKKSAEEFYSNKKPLGENERGNKVSDRSCLFRDKDLQVVQKLLLREKLKMATTGKLLDHP